jgi:hypothetical protein
MHADTALRHGALIKNETLKLSARYTIIIDSIASISKYFTEVAIMDNTPAKLLAAAYILSAILHIAAHIYIRFKFRLKKRKIEMLRPAAYLFTAFLILYTGDIMYFLICASADTIFNVFNLAKRRKPDSDEE